jgi:hypothetical protein
MALVGAACALTLVLLVGVRVESARAGERSDAGWTVAPLASQRNPSVSPDLLGHIDPLVGVHQPSGHGQLEGSRPTHKPPLHPKRFASRYDSVARLDTRPVALTRTLLSCALPSCPHRIADRPLIANCPTRGPPRTA